MSLLESNSLESPSYGLAHLYSPKDLLTHFFGRDFMILVLLWDSLTQNLVRAFLTLAQTGDSHPHWLHAINQPESKIPQNPAKCCKDVAKMLQNSAKCCNQHLRMGVRESLKFDPKW